MSVQYPWWEALRDALVSAELAPAGFAGDTSHIDPRATIRAFATFDGSQLLRLDPACRYTRYWIDDRRREYRREWRIPEEADAAAAYLFLAGCDSSGFRRQQAISASLDHHPALVALQLIRCDDWVSAVRADAENTLRTRLRSDAGVLFEHLDLIARLRTHERFAAGAWTRLVAPALEAPALADARMAALHAGTSLQRLFIADIILRADPEQQEALFTSCLRSRDPLLARWGLQQIVERGLDADWVDVVIDEALEHPSARIALQALRLRARRRDDGLPALIARALLSPQRSTRDFAAHISPQCGIDAMQYWRETVDTPDRAGRVGALCALCERATAEDFDPLERWVAHPSGDVRRTVLAGLFLADSERSRPHLIAALHSTAIKDARLALKLGAGLDRFMTSDTLSAAYRDQTHPAIRALLLSAMRRLWAWDALECLLDGLSGPWRNVDHDALVVALSQWQGPKIGRLPAPRCAYILERIDTVEHAAPTVDWTRIRKIVRDD